MTVALSTASCYPEPCETGFRLASELGYDGVEVMVWTDPVSQSVEQVRELSDRYDIPVVSVHAPSLLLTQRVWGNDPLAKLERSTDMAQELGARTVVTHPPFRWQREWARRFNEEVARLHLEREVVVAVENMFPWRFRGREVMAYAPHWDPLEEDWPAVTLDLSHTAISGVDALATARSLAGRLEHLHLADGSGSGRDEHLAPGRGTQPCAEVLQHLSGSGSGFDGVVVLEVSTRHTADAHEREALLRESLDFARRHYHAPAEGSRR